MEILIQIVVTFVVLIGIIIYIPYTTYDNEISIRIFITYWFLDFPQFLGALGVVALMGGPLLAIAGIADPAHRPITYLYLYLIITGSIQLLISKGFKHGNS